MLLVLHRGGSHERGGPSGVVALLKAAIPKSHTMTDHFPLLPSDWPVPFRDLGEGDGGKEVKVRQSSFERSTS